MQKKIVEFDKLTVKNTLNARYYPTPGEVNGQPSLTVPDQAMSLKEILRRFASGIPMDAGKVPIYDEENDLPDFTKMDLADREALAQEYAEEVREIKERVKERETKRAEKLLLEKLEKEKKQKESDNQDKTHS